MMNFIRKIDIRKPTHAVLIGLIMASIIAPIAEVVAINERYRLGKAAAVAEKPSPSLKEKLRYEKDKQQTVFNAEGMADVAAGAKDLLQTKTGSGDKDSTQLYSATLPDKAPQGIKITDNVNKVDVTFKPLFETLDGRKGDGQVVYPLKGQPGAMVFTPKGNGLKEDIILTASPGDSAEYSYDMEFAETLEARMLPSGGIGFYSGDPQLYGNITYGSEEDRQKVEKARLVAEKTYLMFSIPAPVIVESGPAHANAPAAKFRLEGKKLTVAATGLEKAHYPLSIDPTFLISSASDFSLGRAEDNIDFGTAGQIGRAAITGGVLNSSGWQSTSPTTACTVSGTNYNFGLTAYNGFLYMVGGGDGASTNVCYAPINTDGSLGTWVDNTNKFATGRTGASVAGFNGYVYVMGGERTPRATANMRQ